MTKYAITKLMARATRARRAYETATARGRAAVRRLTDTMTLIARKRWEDLERELEEARRGGTDGKA